MARAHRVLTYTTILTTIYILAFFQFISVPFVEQSVVEQVLPVIPWWLLVSFGSYALWSLGYGLWSFRDTPDAYHELLNQITEAKNDLRARGVSVD